MNMLVFSVYDKAVGAFMQPFFLQSVGAALRAFEDLVSDDNSAVSRHPEDYSLAQIAAFDNNTGFIKPIESGAIFLMQAIEVVERLRKKDSVERLTQEFIEPLGVHAEHFDDAERRANEVIVTGKQPQ